MKNKLDYWESTHNYNHRQTQGQDMLLDWHW